MKNVESPKKYTQQTRQLSFRKMLLAGCLIVLGVAGVAFGHSSVFAAACSNPSTDNGTDTMTLQVPAAATYTIWTRIMVPDSSHNSVNLQVDSSTCFNVGDSTSIPANTWTWVNYQNGATATPNTASLSAGNHTIKLIGTDAGVSVDRVILASDSSCVPTGKGDSCASGDSTAPTVVMLNPANNSTATGNVTFQATAADASGIASVKYLVDGNIVGTGTGGSYSYAWNSASVGNGAHTVVARAVDNAGNSKDSASITVNVNNVAVCSTSPSVPGNLAVTGHTSSAVSLSWSASTPGTNCAMHGYNVYRNSTLVTTVTSGTTYTDTGLTPSTTYSYKIAAVDSSTPAHASAQSSSVSATTSADTTAPSVPTSVHTTLTTSNAIALAWTASTDNVKVTGYTIYRNGTSVGTSTNATYTDSGLTPNTTYTYTIKAYDAKGNQSAASSALSAKTLAGTAANTGDLNGDGKVNIGDFSILLTHWKKSGVSLNNGDINGDGQVTITDLSILLTHWRN